jgi:hypothetical protein
LTISLRVSSAFPNRSVYQHCDSWQKTQFFYFICLYTNRHTWRWCLSIRCCDGYYLFLFKASRRCYPKGFSNLQPFTIVETVSSFLQP